MSRLTVITSVYEATNFIEQFLYNIEQQSVFHICELHLVCCNPSMSHADNRICLEFAQRHDNVKYYSLIPDPGLYAVWNYVIQNTNTEYITNANVDDRLHPLCWEKHIDALDKNESVDLVYCKTKCSFEPNKDFYEVSDLALYPTDKFSKKGMLRSNLPHNHPVWRRTLHDRFGLFNTEFSSASDWEFWLRCVSGGAKFMLIPEILGVYYWNPSGISTNSNTLTSKRIEENNVYRRYAETLK